MAVRRGFVQDGFDRLSFLVFRAFRFAANLLPWSFAYTAGDMVALAWWAVDQPHRRLALENLGIAFPDWEPGRRRRAAFLNFRNLCRVLVETLRYEKLTPENWRDRVDLVHGEHFEKASALGRGVVAVSGHTGNWEWLSAHAFRYGRVNIVAREIHNERMDREIRERREKAGVHQIYPTRRSPREILKVLRAGETVCFLVDQSAKGEEGVSVPFFGRPAPTHVGPAVIALRADAPVLPVFTRRTPDNRVQIVYQEPLTLVRTGDRQRDVEENTALITRQVEAFVRDHPDQWFWVHDRWRIGRRRRRGRRR
ncbi:MAG: lysophospholipid acyltransferase family protein [Planctomycetota bacterium]|jgi:KDO2-lipid IV(A) lauroyltransferase